MVLAFIIFAFFCVPYDVAVSTPVQRLCPLGQFLDEVSGRCTPCGEICEHLEEKDTGNVCAHACPDFKAEPKQSLNLCPPDTYLDSTLRCELCSDICSREKKDDRCESKCPGYVDKSPEKVKLNIILWAAVVFLSIVLLLFITAIVLKAYCIKRQARSRHSNYKKDAPFIVPYLKLDEEKPNQRVNQWLTLLHSAPVEGENRFGSKMSSIYTPPKTKV